MRALMSRHHDLAINYPPMLLHYGHCSALHLLPLMSTLSNARLLFFLWSSSSFSVCLSVCVSVHACMRACVCWRRAFQCCWNAPWWTALCFPLPWRVPLSCCHLKNVQMSMAQLRVLYLRSLICSQHTQYLAQSVCTSQPLVEIIPHAV